MVDGLSYLVDSAYRDPLLVLILLIGGVSAPLRVSRGPLRWLLLSGVCYALYPLFIGGDFMSGRFLTAPVVLVALTLIHLPIKDPIWVPAFAAALFPAMGAMSDHRADIQDTDCNIGPAGVPDERSCYAEHTALSQNINAQKWRSHGYLRDYDRAVKERAKDGVVVFPLIGMVGFSDHSELHIVESMGLSDPLLARIRYQSDGRERPGHFRREIPAGYVESLRQGKNLLEDECLAELYQRLDLVTTGPLFSGRRWKAIWDLQTCHRACDPP